MSAEVARDREAARGTAFLGRAEPRGENASPARGVGGLLPRPAAPLTQRKKDAMSRNREVQDAAEAADEARIQVEEAWLAVKDAEDAYRSRHADWQSKSAVLAKLTSPASGPTLEHSRRQHDTGANAA